jgi:hypothetical protein
MFVSTVVVLSAFPLRNGDIPTIQRGDLRGLADSALKMIQLHCDI